MRLKLNNCTYIVLSNQQLMKIPNELILNLKGCATSTRYIKHLAESANFKDVTSIQHCNGLIGNRSEMPNVSYTQTI